MRLNQKKHHSTKIIDYKNMALCYHLTIKLRQLFSFSNYTLICFTREDTMVEEPVKNWLFTTNTCLHTCRKKETKRKKEQVQKG